MNQTLQSIKKRYSCRSFTGVIPEDEKIQAIVQAAIQSPSARNKSPWQIIVVRNKELINEMEAEGTRMLGVIPEYKSFYDMLQERGSKLYYNAPCMIIIPKDKNNSYSSLDCGIVSQTIAVAAQSLGIASCICGFAEAAFSGERGAYFKERLNFPEGYEFGIAVLLGNAEVVKDPHETQQEKITFID